MWDRMFGTFEPEIREEDPEPLFYGVVPQLKSYNMWYANTHHFYHMLFVQTNWHGIATPFKHWTPKDTQGCPKLGSKVSASEREEDAAV